MKRRTFISSALKSGVGLAGAKMILTKDLFANGKTPANELVNIGIIGIGKMANLHINSLTTSPTCKIVAVSDVDDMRLEYTKKNIEQRYTARGMSSDVKMYKDFRDLLADKTVDAVFIVTPDHWHAIMCILAARAGKHIYCEKPLTFTIEEGAKVLAAVKENGVVFQTGSQQRSDAAFRWLAQMTRSGMVGDVKEIYCNFGRKYPMQLNFAAEELPKGMDWDMWIGPAPYRPYTSRFLPDLVGVSGKKTVPSPFGFPWTEWRWHMEYGNGLQADWGAHHLDIAMWAMGLDGKGPEYVEVFKSQNPDNPQDNHEIRYILESGVPINYGAPDSLKGKTNEKFGIYIVGSEGTIAANRGDKRYASKKSLLNAKPPADGPFLTVSDNHRENFLSAVKNNGNTICPAEVGVSSCNTCLIGNIAHQLGRTLRYDWRTQSFTNDEIANRYLSRKNRGEWANV